MASAPRVPCVQETQRQERYENLTNVTGTPITVVDTVCGGQAPPDVPATPGNIGDPEIQGSTNCNVGYSGRYYLVPEPGAADATYAWSVDTGANITAPNTEESAEVNFTAAGTTVITVVITSATASDSPVTKTLSVTVAA